jgi:predicted amidohydrolase YtcJ
LSVSCSPWRARPPAQPPAAADLIVTNGRIYTVDPNRPFVDAMAIKDGRVVFVGPARLAQAYKEMLPN